VDYIQKLDTTFGELVNNILDKPMKIVFLSDADFEKNCPSNAYVYHQNRYGFSWSDPYGCMTDLSAEQDYSSSTLYFKQSVWGPLLTDQFNSSPDYDQNTEVKLTKIFFRMGVGGAVPTDAVQDEYIRDYLKIQTRTTNNVPDVAAAIKEAAENTIRYMSNMIPDRWVGPLVEDWGRTKIIIRPSEINDDTEGLLHARTQCPKSKWTGWGPWRQHVDGTGECTMELDYTFWSKLIGDHKIPYEMVGHEITRLETNRANAQTREQWNDDGFLLTRDHYFLQNWDGVLISSLTEKIEPSAWPSNVWEKSIPFEMIYDLKIKPEDEGYSPYSRLLVSGSPGLETIPVPKGMKGRILKKVQFADGYDPEYLVAFKSPHFIVCARVQKRFLPAVPGDASLETISYAESTALCPGY